MTNHILQFVRASSLTITSFFLTQRIYKELGCFVPRNDGAHRDENTELLDNNSASKLLNRQSFLMLPLGMVRPTDRGGLHLIIVCLFLIMFQILGADINQLKDGERLVFDIKYGVVTAGEAALNLQKVEYQDNEVWKITSTAETNSFFDKVYRVRDIIESISTHDELLSLVFTKRLSEGKYRQHRIHQNYAAQNLSVYSNFRFSRGEWEETRIEIPEGTFDLMSAFYKVRTLDLQPGQSIPLNVTTDGKNYNALVNVLRTETINTIFGRIECVVIEPSLEGEAIFQQTGDIHIWLTNDENKIPVLLQSKIVFGHFRAILKSAS